MESRSEQRWRSRYRVAATIAVVVMCLVVGTGGGTVSAGQPQAVTITTVGELVEGGQSGTFAATGAIVDEGTFTFHVERGRDFAFAGFGAPTFGIARSVEFFVGQQGAFALQNVITFTLTDEPGVFAVGGTWAVLNGTGAYARLRGHGTITGVIDDTVDPESFLFTFSGSVHFD